MPATTYNTITPRQNAFSVANFLKRAAPLLTIEKFGQAHPVPKNNTQVAKFRRYFLEGATGSASGESGDFYTPKSLTPLQEGVTPAGKRLASKDYTVQLAQYGDFLEFTDVIQDTHEDLPALMREMTDILGESAAQSIETLRFNVLVGGSNVFYANGVARDEVNTPLTLTLQRRVTRSLKRQNASSITSVVKSSPAFNMQPIESAFIGLVHPDVENDIRDMDGFISTKHYASISPMDGEIGSVEDVRYIRSTVFEAFEDAGDTAGAMLSTSGTNADVYPVLYIARDAYGIVPLKGKESVEMFAVNPSASTTDPIAQRGTVGWKTWTATVILQDAFLIRAEVAATE